MKDQFIFLHEALLLAAWLSLPALLLSTVLQAAFYRRKRARLSRALAAICASAFIVVPTAALLWVLLPASWAAPHPIPGLSWSWFVPPLFLPSYLSCAMVVPFIAWLVVRSQPALQANAAAPRGLS